MADEKVTGAVYETDTGFILRITVDGPDTKRVANLDVGQDRAEAFAILRSLQEYVRLSLPIIGVFIPDDDQPVEEAST